MSAPKVNLKNPMLAALLAFLLPGAGHLYQGRMFKAALYAVCILGLFGWGQALGNWQTTYCRFEPQHRTLGYLAQVMVGTPSLIAVVQNQRYEPLPAQRPGGRFQGDFDGIVARAEKSPNLKENLDEPFEGRALITGGDGTPSLVEVTGRIRLENAPGQFGFGEARGVFRGTTSEGQEVEWPVTLLEISPKVFAYEDVSPQLVLNDGPVRREFASSRRYLRCEIEDQAFAHVSQLEGTVPRAFWNWFEVPLEQDGLQHLHRTLGKQYEVALVLTWIAGLLNLLAVWDALEGPAYGYGYEDEERRKREREEQEKLANEKQHQQALAAAAPTPSAGRENG